jgi:hypothetical protein
MQAEAQDPTQTQQTPQNLPAPDEPTTVNSTQLTPSKWPKVPIVTYSPKNFIKLSSKQKIPYKSKDQETLDTKKINLQNHSVILENIQNYLRSQKTENFNEEDYQSAKEAIINLVISESQEAIKKGEEQQEDGVSDFLKLLRILEIIGEKWKMGRMERMGELRGRRRKRRGRRWWRRW